MTGVQLFTDVLQTDPDAWAIRINASWRRSFESVIETGRLLIDAKAQLAPHGTWLSLVEQKLDFAPWTAQRLMSIARDNRLTNPTHVSLLPRSYATLYELTKLTDEEFSIGVQNGVICPDMERKDVEIIRPKPLLESSSAVERLAVNEDVAGSKPAFPASSDGGSAADGVRASDDRTSTAHHEARGSTPAVPASEAILPHGARAIMGSRQEASDSLDHFPTPPWATRALLEHVFPHLERRGVCKFQKAWEPACGKGHMAEVLREYFREVRATDIADYGYGDGEHDFLASTNASLGYDWIITNPPFNDRTEPFVLKALALAGSGVAMFVRLQWLEGVGRYERIYSVRPPTLVSFFAERVPLHKGQWDPDGSTATAYIWLVWLKGAEPRAPFWIPPGRRAELTTTNDIKKFGNAIVEGEAA